MAYKAYNRPHTRLVNIRFSVEEVSVLQCATSNSSETRSVSAYCRERVLRSIASTRHSDVREVKRRLLALEYAMDRINSMIP